MKLRFFFCLLFFVCFNTVTIANNDSIDTLSKSNGCSCSIEYLDSLLTNTDLNTNPSLSDSLTYTTALINALNNAISIQNNNIDLIAIIVAVIGVLATLLGIGIAVAGFIRFKDLKDDINNYKNSIQIDYQRFKTSLNDDLREYKEGVAKDTKEFKAIIESTLKEYKEDESDNIKEFKVSVKDWLKEYKEGMDNDIKEYKTRFDDVFKKQKDNMDSDFKKYIDNIDKRVIEIKQGVENKVTEINLLKDRVDEKAKEIDNISKEQTYQSQYWQTINQSLFLITNSVVDTNHGDDEKSSSIRKNLYNQYYILKAFFPWSDSSTDGTEAAFRYLQVHGSEENIADLRFIADNDPDDRKKSIARETIGFIKADLMNKQE